MRNTSSLTTSPIAVRLIGGPTVLIEIGGLRLLTDPTFDPPGPFGTKGAMYSVKERGPAIQADELGHIDAVLLSHDEHFDNLDVGGRAMLEQVGLVLSTPGAAERLGGAVRGLEPYATHDILRPDGGTLTVTATPALHGPPGAAAAMGVVTGFWLRGDGLPTVYVSGDNASVELVEEIVERLGPADVAIPFAGAVSDPNVFDSALLTMGAERVVHAARTLGAHAVVPVHMEGWQHLGEAPADLVTAFGAAGLADVLRLLTPGERISLAIPRDPQPARV